MHRILAEKDSAAASTLRPTDGQRIVRALEVIDASGRSILDWQSQKGAALIDGSVARKYVIRPDRTILAERISRRFDHMMAGPAVDEVRALLALNLAEDAQQTPRPVHIVDVEPAELADANAGGVQQLNDQLIAQC